MPPLFVGGIFSFFGAEPIGKGATMEHKKCLAAVLLAFFSFFLALSVSEARLHGAAAHTERRGEKEKSPLPPYVDFGGGYSVYDPAKDVTPNEGLDVAETNFFFFGPLLVRPWTDAIVVHHVGVPDGDVSSSHIHRAHIGNGWQGIGYHYVIRQDGTIERGRPLATIGAHAYRGNYHTVGINLSGNFDRERPTGEQIDSLIRLLAFLCRHYRLTPGEATIVGHRDVNYDTACPGYHLYVLLPEIRQAVAEELHGSASGDEAAYRDVKILGEPELKEAQIVRYILRKNPNPQLNCTVEELVRYYYEEGTSEGVRADVAICQAIKETGCFAFGGDVHPSQNNYCGLGATGGGVRGQFFAAPRRGVRAHIQHLMAYATTRLPQQPILDERYDVLREKYPQFYGKVETWVGLSGKWALPGRHYGQDILQIFEEIKAEG